MKEDVILNLGPQPILQIMTEQGLKPHDLVAASGENLTHKMVSRACKGRRLTRNTKSKVLNAMNKLSKTAYSESDLFNY